jgi:hypothetical protein
VKLDENNEGTTEEVRCDGFAGPCERTDAKRQRQNTAYEDDSQNWVTLCPECMEANKEYWVYMWMDYNSGRL